jgi:hypothetical protein
LIATSASSSSAAPSSSVMDSLRSVSAAVSLAVDATDALAAFRLFKGIEREHQCADAPGGSRPSARRG